MVSRGECLTLQEEREYSFKKQHSNFDDNFIFWKMKENHHTCTVLKKYKGSKAKLNRTLGGGWCWV